MHATASDAVRLINVWGDDEPALQLAGADLCNLWTGWIEGGIVSGRDAARKMYPYLYPDKIPRNMRKVVLPRRRDEKVNIP